MGKMRVGLPPSNNRSARRSLVELTAAASRALDDGLFVMSAGQVAVAASADEAPRLEQAANTSSHSIDATRAAAPSRVAVPGSRNATGSRNEELVDSDSAADMLVKIVKDYQNKAFENIKANLNAALEHAKDFAEKRVVSEATSKHSSASLDDFLTVPKGVKEFNAEALELIKANAIATLEYAWGLAGTTSAAEFVELSSAQVRKQCELILKQAGALTFDTQVITKSSDDGCP